MASFESAPRSRIVVLATIICLHGALAVFITMFRPETIKSPEALRVLMTKIILEQAVAQPTAPAPPVLKPVARPVPKRVFKPTIKPVETPPPATKPRVETQPVPEATASAPSAEPSSPGAAVTAVTAAPELPAPPVVAVAITPPRFNAAYLNNPAPTYPVMARRMGEEGKVLLRVFVTPDGTAGDVRIQNSSGSPLFDAAAMAAVRQWRFVPARQGETAVAAWVQVPIVFRLT